MTTDNTFIPEESQDKLVAILIDGALVGNRETMEQVEEIFDSLMAFPDTMVSKLLDFVNSEEDHQDELYQECDEIVQETKLIEQDDEEMREAMTLCMEKAMDDLSNSLETLYFNREALYE